DSPPSGGEFEMSAVAKIVAADQTLTAMVLRQANSVAVSGTEPVEDLDRACSRIGVAAINQLAIASGLGRVAGTTGPLCEVRSIAWRQSVCAAELCQYLAGGRELEAGEAYLAGLL